jgi:hypothetical protein
MTRTQKAITLGMRSEGITYKTISEQMEACAAITLL